MNNHSAGQVVEEGYYLPWGGERGNQEIELTDYGYTGQIREGDIYFFNARYYDPAIGRFMQAGTIVPMATQGTQAFDRYAYVNNNPMLYRDENGHWITTLVGGIIGAAIGYGVQVYQNVQTGMEFSDALTTNISAEEILAGAAVGALAGTLLPVAAAAISTTGLFTTATTTTTAACADGDCTNEVQVAKQVVEQGAEKASQAIQTSTNTVYRLVENGLTKYIGITNNFGRRFLEHLSNHNWRVQPIDGLEQLSRFDARAVEQILIEDYGLSNLYNQIYSISTSNPIYSTAIQRGREILDTLQLLK